MVILKQHQLFFFHKNKWTPVWVILKMDGRAPLLSLYRKKKTVCKKPPLLQAIDLSQCAHTIVFGVSSIATEAYLGSGDPRIAPENAILLSSSILANDITKKKAKKQHSAQPMLLCTSSINELYEWLKLFAEMLDGIVEPPLPETDHQQDDMRIDSSCFGSIGGYGRFPITNLWEQHWLTPINSATLTLPSWPRNTKRRIGSNESPSLMEEVFVDVFPDVVNHDAHQPSSNNDDRPPDTVAPPPIHDRQVRPISFGSSMFSDATVTTEELNSEALSDDITVTVECGDDGTGAAVPADDLEEQYPGYAIVRRQPSCDEVMAMLQRSDDGTFSTSPSVEEGNNDNHRGVKRASKITKPQVSEHHLGMRSPAVESKPTVPPKPRSLRPTLPATARECPIEQFKCDAAAAGAGDVEPSTEETKYAVGGEIVVHR